MKRALFTASVLGVIAAASAASAEEEPFTFDPPGILTPTKSGSGRQDATLYVRGIRFPIESGPAYANSQVYGHGGGQGPGGGQCDKANYSYPWRDTYCESRSWDMPLCPSGKGHQGVDIRPATCEKGVHWSVAVADGTITSVGSYSVYLTTPNGTRYDYLHMSDVTVKAGDTVTRGQRLGKVSNAFGGTPTTIHLHFNVRQNVAGVGDVFVPPYASLVRSYQELLGLVPPEPEPPAETDEDEVVTTPPAETPSDPRRPNEAKDEPPLLAVQASAEAGCASAKSPAPSGGLFAVAFGALLAGALRRRRRR